MNVRAELAVLFTTTLLACGARTGLGSGSQSDVDAATVHDASDASDGGRDSAIDVARDVAPDAPLCPIPFDATTKATLRITTDDEYILYVNGVLIDDVPRLWSNAQTYDLPIFRHPSRRNSIAIQGTNQQNVGGRDRGIVADLRFTAGTSEARLVTDGAWRMSTILVTGWNGAAFDASGWSPVVDEGPYGMAPWGNVFGTPSTARWVWSFDSNLPANQKVVKQTIWIHRDFYVDVAGNVRDTPTPCP